MNCNYNEFIEISEPYEVGSPFYGLKPPDTVVGITNSYPIYLKLQEDMKNEIYLDESFIKHKKLAGFNFVKFMNGIDTSLTEFIKGLYLEGKNRNLLQYPFKYIQVLNCYNNFQFIFAKRGGSLVFLNYIPSNQKITFEDLIPYVKEEKHNHVITLNNKKTYRITNTYDVFNNYANINILPRNYGVNLYLYPNFINTVKSENFKTFEYIIQNECILYGPNGRGEINHFEYFVLNNIIIINTFNIGL